MIKARKERVRELIRSLESVQMRSHALGKEESALEGRSSSLTETGACKNDAAHSTRRRSTRSRAPSITWGSLWVMTAM